MTRPIGDLWGDRRGAITILAAASLLTCIGGLAFAVDLGSIYYQTRHLQGVADAAALSAAGNLHDAHGAARQAVTANGWASPYDLSATLGAYSPDPSKTVGQRFVTDVGAVPPDAARVRIDSHARVFFGMALLGRNTIPISRSATAARANMASFSLGSRLGSVDGGIANALLTGLTGSKVSLSVMDYNALLGADIDLFAFSKSLQTQLNMQGASFDDVLATKVSVGAAFGALANAMTAAGSGTAADTIRKLATGLHGSDMITLGELLDLGPAGAQNRVGGANAIQVNAFDMVTAVLGLANKDRQVALDLGTAIPGLAKVTVKLAIGDRVANSPWLAVTNNGQPVLRTAQMRLYVDASVLPVGSVLGIASVRFPLYVELAEAQARLGSISCSGGRTVHTVALSVQPAIGHASIADLSPSDISNHHSPVTEGPAKIVALPLIGVSGQSRVDLTAPGWQTVSFDANEIAAKQVKTVSSNTLVQGIAASLVGKMALNVNVGPLGLGLAPVTALVGATLTPAAPLIDGVINSLTGLLGIHLGQADVRVNGVRCGVPALVA